MSLWYGVRMIWYVCVYVCVCLCVCGVNKVEEADALFLLACSCVRAHQTSANSHNQWFHPRFVK